MEEWKSIKAKTTYVRDDINPDAVKYKKEAKAEEAIISRLLLRPDDCEMIEAEAPADIFVTEFNRRVYTAILSAIKNSDKFTLSLLNDEFTPQEMGKISGISAENREFSVTDQALKDCADVLKKHKNSISADQGGDISEDQLRALFDSKRK